MRHQLHRRRFGIAVLTLAAATTLGWHPHARAADQTTAFTYQGVLRQSNAPFNGSVDLQFSLFDAASGGAQVGATIPANAVTVVDGLITQPLDFGSLAFNGQARWLEVSVRTPAGSANPFIPLVPRQSLASAPYANFALAANLGGTYAGAVSFTNAANTFAGSGSALTNLNAANLSPGTAGISITGNAATATSAGNVSGIVAIINGGTGANSAATARTNLGAAATAHTHASADITSGNFAIARMPLGGSWTLTSNLNFDSNTIVVDQLNNRIGIGNAAPQATLHVGGSYTATIPSSIARINGSMSVNGTVLSEDGSVLSRSSVGNNAASLILDAEANAGGTSWFINSHANASPFGSPGGSLTFTNSADRLAITSAGNVGINTVAPEAPLHVFEGSAGTITASSNASLALERSAANFLNLLAPDASESGVLFGNPTTGSAAGGVIFNSPTNLNGLQLRAGGNSTKVTILANGDVGVGVTAPEGRLHVTGGGDVEPTGGGDIVTGSITSLNLAFDNNEIMARNNGAVATLNLNTDGGDVTICSQGTGKLITPVIEITGADLAEEFPFSENAEPGMVVAIDPNNPGQLCVARGAYNSTVAGIIAGGNNFPTGAVLGRKSGAESGRPVALSGRVYVRAADVNGEIRPGDLLTTSDIPGVAMKATDPQRMTGAILGKAMTGIDRETGFVLVLVNLH